MALQEICDVKIAEASFLGYGLYNERLTDFYRPLLQSKRFNSIAIKVKQRNNNLSIYFRSIQDKKKEEIDDE